MKQTKKILEKDGSGFITLQAEDSEDQWHVYNLLRPGDTLKASTVRSIVSESNTGSTEKSTVRITLTIIVHQLFFDSQVCVLRVNGTIY